MSKKRLTTSDIVNQTYEDMMQMSSAELKSAIKTMQGTIRKRQAVFKKQGLESPAYSKLEKSGGQLSVKDKSRGQLLRELARGKEFLRSKTSTVTGYKSFRNNAMKRLNVSWTDAQYKDFWSAYDTFNSNYPTFAEIFGDSVPVQKFMAAVYDKNGENFANRMEQIRDSITYRNANEKDYNIWDYLDTDKAEKMFNEDAEESDEDYDY